MIEVGRVMALSHVENNRSVWIEVGRLELQADGTLTTELLATPFTWSDQAARRVLRVEPRTLKGTGDPLDLTRSIWEQIDEARKQRQGKEQ
jgi:hypothetical protein